MAEIPNLSMQYTVDEHGNRRIIKQHTYQIVDKNGNKVYDDQNNELTYTQTATASKIIASDAGDAGTILNAGSSEIEFSPLDIAATYNSQVQFASTTKKAALLADIENATNLGELAIATKAITDSYNSTVDNIGKSGYEKAMRLAAAKKLSFETGASDTPVAGNATNVQGNAYSVHDADSCGDNRTADIVDGNSDDFNAGSIRDDAAEVAIRHGNNGRLTEGDGDNIVSSTGTGNGNGNNAGDGNNGDGNNASAKNKKTSRISNEEKHNEVSTMNSVNTTSIDASIYADEISTEPQINHIFHNSFYNVNAVPVWSFSVDFIPCAANNSIFAKYVTLSDMKVLTEAIQTITANDKTVNIGKIYYLGMQHPFLTKMSQTHGDLIIKFAENEEYTITKILVKLLKFGSYSPSFPTAEIPLNVSLAEMEDAIVFDRHIDVMQAATDDESPAYKLNAIELPMDSSKQSADIHFAKLATSNKFLFDVVLKLYRPADAHIFGDDDTCHPQYIYHYHNCWLKQIDQLALNYNDDTMIDRSATLSYQYLSTNTYAEYKQKYETATGEIEPTTPNTTNSNTTNTVSEDLDATEQKTAVEQAKKQELEVEQTLQGNMSPANMTPEGAAEFRTNYKSGMYDESTMRQQAQWAAAAYGRRR